MWTRTLVVETRWFGAWGWYGLVKVRWTDSLDGAKAQYIPPELGLKVGWWGGRLRSSRQWDMGWHTSLSLGLSLEVGIITVEAPTQGWGNGCGTCLSLEIRDGADKIVSARKIHPADIRHRLCCLHSYHKHRVGFQQYSKEYQRLYYHRNPLFPSENHIYLFQSILYQHCST